MATKQINFPAKVTKRIGNLTITVETYDDDSLYLTFHRVHEEEMTIDHFSLSKNEAYLFTVALEQVRAMHAGKEE